MFRTRLIVLAMFSILCAMNLGAATPAPAPHLEKATLGGGCFWGLEDLLRKLPGVVHATVGYTGGDVPNATYENHEGHAESVELLFDPAKISYEQILLYFFKIHDPTTLNRQGNDVGTSYRSVIFYHDEQQRRTAEAVKARVDKSGAWKRGDADRPGENVLDRRGVPPGLPQEEPRRLHLPLRTPHHVLKEKNVGRVLQPAP